MKHFNPFTYGWMPPDCVCSKWAVSSLVTKTLGFTLVELHQSQENGPLSSVWEPDDKLLEGKKHSVVIFTIQVVVTIFAL